MSTKIKICGIRRQEDVEAVNAFMPDYVGFIFWDKSFRNITLQQAQALRERIDCRIPAAGVFVDEEPERIRKYVRSGAIQAVQLHGHETEETIGRLKEMLGDIPVWKAFRVRSEEDLRRAERSPADEIVLDNGCGTGQCFDHGLLTGMKRNYILAGGLTPENIAAVIGTYRPYMADISSGVETGGCKDREKIRRAVEAVRQSGAAAQTMRVPDPAIQGMRNAGADNDNAGQICRH